MFANMNHPVEFLFVISLGVIAIEAILRWCFMKLGWSGPAALVNGGGVGGNAA
ncbi:MAG TPA: hypothetical protein VMV29_12900 [Ktedonobacterales bacterium]|nr:hypothetical protein [Ktedonobacterales bacterium]